MENLDIQKTTPGAGYALIDSGDGEKLERYGEVILRRPDPQALWPKNHPEKWEKADAFFTREGKKGTWTIKSNVPSKWPIDLAGMKFVIKPTSFKHTGLFPEQEPNWQWIKEVVGFAPKPVRVLNLFGYTGGATLAAAKAGADVCHVDGSKAAINWGKENAELSGLADKPIRWMLDDARAFLRREIKRGNKYDGIIMDPPAFGHGPDGEEWQIEDHFLDLLDLCRQVLSEKPLFMLVNGYASGYSAIAYKNNLEKLTKNWGGTIEAGEMTIQEEGSGRLLPAGIYARWRA